MALLVKTKSGFGVVIGERAGKLMAEIVNDDMSQKMSDGKPMNILVSKVSTIPVGFVSGYKSRTIDDLESLQDYIG